MTCLASLPILLCALAPSPQDAEVQFVRKGVSLEANEHGAPWRSRSGFLEAQGTGRYLIGNRSLGAGDVHVSARLALMEIGGTAASLAIGGSNFGFDARGGGLFVEGPLFGGAARATNRPATLTAGRAFLAEVVRKGGELTLLLDGVVVHRVEVGDQPLGVVALRPWRSKMRVHDFSARGDLTESAVPDYVWRSGTDGYHTYRIPALIATRSGTLLAFCEGRKSGSSDSGDIDLLVKRSTDGGRTWSAQKVVWDDDDNTCGNPCPVVDETTGTVWLLMTHNLGRDHERQIIARESEGTRTVWVTSSRDDGQNWAKPREITKSAKRRDWTWYATGPGVGIQLRQGEHRGRLLVPCDHIEAGTKKYFSHVIWSDDHGATWQLGGSSPTDQVNECQVAELGDGQLMLNMRNYDRRQRTRAVCVSDDGGATWQGMRHDPVLVEPICQASLIRYRPDDVEDRRLLFSNPGSARARVQMTLRLSPDGGASWTAMKLLHPGPAAYSCLCALPDEAVSCLYEAGVLGPYEGIAFAAVRLSELGR